MSKQETSPYGIERKGIMLVISSPSGAGKSALSRRLLETDSRLRLSVSATTRPPRPGETEGKDYFFVSKEDFDAQVKAGEFLEHAKVFDYAYGTPKEPILTQLKNGHDVLFDIDWQGTQQLKASMGAEVVSVFILPPSIAELEQRLKKRAQDSDEVVARRMAKASDEASHYAEYDYIIINDDIDRATQELTSILLAERLKRKRQKGLTDFVKTLRQGK